MGPWNEFARQTERKLSWALSLLLGFGSACGGPGPAQNASASVSGDGPYKVVHGWPRLPDGFALGQVAGVAVDSHEHVFVFHRGNKPVVCLDAATGEVVDMWGEGLFLTPHGMTVDGEGNLWLTDTRLHQVFQFSHSGEPLLTLGVREVPGDDAEHFDGPTDVAIGPGGEVYVADGYGNNRIVQLSPKGEFVRQWGQKGTQPGEFDLPHGIATDPRGRIYVADRGNARIQVFDAQTGFLQQWQSEELGRPWGLDIGPGQLLYVVDGGDLRAPETMEGLAKTSFPNADVRNHALRLGLDGGIQAKWGSFGSYDGQFYWAHDVAAGPDGSVYVADVYLGMRVQKFVAR